MTRVIKKLYSNDAVSGSATAALHSGYRSDPTTGAVAVPIYQTTAYELTGDLDYVADVYNVRADGFTYTRIINPTTRILERRFADMAKGVDCLAVASGQSATFLSLANLISGSGKDNIIASPYLYGNTWNLLKTTLPRLGVETRFIDFGDSAAVKASIDENTIAIFGESISNPCLIPFPFLEIGNIAKSEGVPLVVDNTVAPVIGKPELLGVNISTFSATKYVCGHGTTLGGLIVDHGNFDYDRSPRFPLFSKGDDAHGSIIWSDACKQVDDLGNSAYLLKCRMTWLRDIGPAISPQSSFQLIQGIETLPLRMKQHCENASEVARMLNDHPKIRSVRYPELFAGKEKELADEFYDLSFGYGPMIYFELEGGLEAGKKLVSNVKLAYHVSNVGDARTLITHPASTTHTTVPKSNRIECGINDGSIRLCVGIENVNNIMNDLLQALEH